MSVDFAELRREYRGKLLDEKDVDHDPVVQFTQWFEQASSLDIDLPNTMSLATVTPEGKPAFVMSC